MPERSPNPTAPLAAVCIVSRRNSDKTALGLALARELKALGKSVAVVRHTGHHQRPDGVCTPDTPDTAQYKLLADAVLTLSPEETALTWPRERTLLEMLPLLTADVLLVEGGERLGWLPRIVLTRPEAECAPASFDGDDDAEALDRGLALAVTTREQADPAGLARLVLERGFALPGVSCGACGRKGCAAFARDMVAGRATLDECVTANQSLVKIVCSGSTFTINPSRAGQFATGLRALLAGFGIPASGALTITLEGT
ncbi:MAG: molybdopterin-guanine dinucleotide biosynthesis protein MobB [Desulfovibrionaceae bacterium]